MQETRRCVYTTSLMHNFAFSLLVTVAMLCGGTVNAEVVSKKITFISAEIAFNTLAEAYRNNYEDLLIAIFGDQYKDFVMIADKTAAREDRLKFAQHYDDHAEVVYLADGSAELIIGQLAWPYPIPAVKKGGKWYLDTARGIDEILWRRIGRNERAAIDICNTYVKAQLVYITKNHGKSDVKEYARKLVSSPGQKDGLYWNSSINGDKSPLDPLLRDQHDYFAGKEKDEPVWGYYYRIITRQGENAPGGKAEYVINNNMVAGFALVAHPADYGSSGIMTFMVNHDGQVFQKDLGEDTLKSVKAIAEYNPDETWRVVTLE